MKRKSLATVIICLIGAMLLIGCGESKSSEIDLKDKLENVKEDTEKKEDDGKDVEKPEKKKKKNKKKDKKQEEPAAEEVDYEALYAPVFDEVLEVLDYGFNMDKEYTYVSGGLSDMVMYSQDGNLFDKIGYQMTDLSGDGVPELLIGSNEEYERNTRSYIYSLCSIIDDKPALVAAGSARSSYNYMGDGHFYYQGSGGVAITIIGENHLSRDGSELVWDDFYFTDEKENGEIGIYYNNTGVFGADDAEELDISENEFSEKMSEFQDRCVTIPWTPIGDYRTGDEKSSEAEPETGYDEPFGKEITIDAATRKKMNVFLSNFSEACLFEYDQDNPDLYKIFWWVEIWSKINKYKSIEYGPRPGDESGDYYEKISLENINKVTDKYLGFTLSEAEASKTKARPEEMESFFYEDGYLFAPAADGEARTYFSIVSKVEDLGNNRLKLYYTMFSQDLDAYFEGKEINYGITNEKAEADPEYEKVDQGYAVVRADGDSYKLEHLE